MACMPDYNFVGGLLGLSLEFSGILSRHVLRHGMYVSVLFFIILPLPYPHMDRRVGRLWQVAGANRGFAA